MFKFITATCAGFLAGWISRARMESRMGPSKGNYGPRRPGPYSSSARGFPPPPPPPGRRREYLYSPSTMAECGGPCYQAWDPRACDCGALWRDEPIRLDPGSVQRGNGKGGPVTPKPSIVPKPQPPGRRLYRGAFYRMAGSDIWHPIGTEPDWSKLAREQLSKR